MKWLASLLLLWSCSQGCAGTETGNPSFDGSLGYDAYSSSPARVALRTEPPEDEGAVRVDSAWLVLGPVRFAKQGQCEADLSFEYEVEGLGAGDHAGTQAPPSRFNLSTGRYCALRLPFEHTGTPPAGAPEALSGHSILITGARSDGVPFTIASAYGSELAIGGDFELDDARGSVVIGFDVARWIGDLGWDAAMPDESGTIRIDATNHAALLHRFESHIASGVALFRDEDGDGVLDDARDPRSSVIATAKTD